MVSNDAAALGIGIISYNRLEALKGCVERVQRWTTAGYRLVIADDGSGDGSAAWAGEQGLAAVTGERRGCAWNKNRALYYLLERTGCDPILLLEDDCWPAEAGWEQAWIEAARRWGHVNLAPPAEHAGSGSGTPPDPIRSAYYAGSCTVSAREALEAVGFLDTRFRGYGCEHVEWSYRFQRLLAARWGPPEGTYPSLSMGVQDMPFGSWCDASDIERNRELQREMLAEPIWRPPWRTVEEEARVREEQRGAVGDRDRGLRS